jgi:hypothetical protein
MMTREDVERYRREMGWDMLKASPAAPLSAWEHTIAQLKAWNRSAPAEINEQAAAPGR